MGYPVCIALLVTSLTVLVASGFLPFLTADVPHALRAKFPKGTVAVALTFFCGSGWTLRRFSLSQNQIADALTLTAAMLGGICLKWLLESLAQRKPMLHEGVLSRSLLTAPLAIWASHGVIGGRLTGAMVLLWFGNGFFWQTLFSDAARLATREPTIIRRREPPTLPYDFRKPQD